MNSISVHAENANGREFFCSCCCKRKAAGRVYDMNVWIDTGNGHANGTITLCESCRSDFHYADLELAAPEMEAEYLRRHAEESESQSFDGDPENSRPDEEWPNEPANQHLTFPKKVNNG